MASSASRPSVSSSPVNVSHVKRNALVVVIALLLMGVVGASVYHQPVQTGTQLLSTVTIVQTTTLVQTTTSQSATVQNQYDVVIMYTEKHTNSIGYHQPTQGYAYLILTMQIQNNVDREFNTNPLYFHLIVNNVKYDLDFATYSLPDTLKSVDVLRGGTLSGSIAFQVPVGTTDYTPTYEALFTTFEINWAHY